MSKGEEIYCRNDVITKLHHAVHSVTDIVKAFFYSRSTVFSNLIRLKIGIGVERIP